MEGVPKNGMVQTDQLRVIKKLNICRWCMLL